MNIIPKLGIRLYNRAVHMVLGTKPPTHKIIRKVNMSELLKIPTSSIEKGDVKLELVMDLPLDVVFSKSVQFRSNENLILSSEMSTHLNPLWDDGTPVATSDIPLYEDYLYRKMETKLLAEHGDGCCSVVPKYTAEEFELLAKRFNELERRFNDLVEAKGV